MICIKNVWYHALCHHIVLRARFVFSFFDFWFSFPFFFFVILMKKQMTNIDIFNATIVALPRLDSPRRISYGQNGCVISLLFIGH